MKKILFLFLVTASSLAISDGATVTTKTPTYQSDTLELSPSALLTNNQLRIQNALSVGQSPNEERWTALYSNLVPWRPAGFGDSLGDDVITTWANDFGRGLGWNGGFLTVTTNSTMFPLTFTHSGDVGFVIQDTNWFTEHFTLTNTADVTFDSGGRFIRGDTFRIAVVGSTNGGTYKIQVQTNGGAFTDVTATLSALTASPTGIVHYFNTNLGEWKLKFVNVTDTNVLIGGGIWASNLGGMSPVQLWRSGGSITDITNVHTNISVPVLTAAGITEVHWAAADYAIEITNALPVFCNLLTRVAPNAPATFIGLHHVTENGPGYPLGNRYIRNYVQARGYSYIDTESYGSTNDLLRRQWVTDGGCVHWSTLGQYILADRVWREAGTAKADNLIVSSRLANRVSLRVVGAVNHASNLVEVATPYGTNLFWITAAGVVTTTTGATFGGAVTGTSFSGNLFIVTGANVISHNGVGSVKFANTTGTDLTGVFLGGAAKSNSLMQVISSSTGATNSTINFRTGDTNGWLNAGAGSFSIPGTNTISAPQTANSMMGAQIWSDGTNLCCVFQNAAGTRTTNKLSMASWP